jgi:two-component system osmolarity sensor histidine kinase EnvZ
LDYKPSGADEVRRAGIAFLAMRRRVERFVQQRTLLLSSVSHDLRTPLTRLRLELSMLSSDVDTKAMRSDLKHMENLLKEFLEFAKGVVKGQVEECDLQALLQERLTLRGQEATVHLDGALIPQLPVRRLAMARAIDNLILNAQLYANGLWCSVVVEEAYVRMIFEDDGPGIPEGQVEEMLQPFARGNSARTLNNAAGTGLGLAIVLDVVQAHGGTLRLTKSESYGGLRVQIELPR